MDEVKFKLRPVEEKPKRGSDKEDNTVMWIVFDTLKQGLETVMRGYQVMAMKFLWGSGKEGVNSRKSGCTSASASWRKGDPFPVPP